MPRMISIPMLGGYLGAAVMFEQITGVSPSGLPVSESQNAKGMPKIDAETFSLLHKAAEEANKMFARKIEGCPPE